MKIKILVLGYFGYITNQLNGQTIKTRHVYKLLKTKSKIFSRIAFYDTQELHGNKLSFIKMLSNILKSNVLIYMPAHNNLRYIFPFIYVICKLKKIKILYFVIGGWLFEYLQTKPLHKIMLSKIHGIFVESNHMRDKLKQVHRYNNVVTLPNFRLQEFIPPFNNNNEYFKIVFMAQIEMPKGVDVVFKLAEHLSKTPLKGPHIIIDFYGPIIDNTSKYFYEQLEKYEFVSYKGELQPDKIYEELTSYDLMVLPTKYYTEGFPGSILDAYIAGVPVVVTQWKYASEFVDNEKTGIIVPFKNGENEFIQSVIKLYEDPNLIMIMKYNAYEKSKLYSAASAWEIIKRYIDYDQNNT